MRLTVFSSVSLLVLMAVMPMTAHAGFEFVTPASNAPAASSAPVSDFVESIAAQPDKAPGAALGESIEEEPLDMAQPLAPAARARADIPLAPIQVPLTPVVKDSDALSIEAQPLASASALPAPIGLPTRFSDTGKMNEGNNVQGFGRGVPLAIALQQIVPPSYRYSFEPPINPSMRISWSGDKPWKVVVADIARSNDMNVDIASNVVSFSRHKPMDMIAASTMTNGPADSVQGVPLRPVAGQIMPDDLRADLPAPVAMPEAASAEPMPIAAPKPLPAPVAPVIADASPAPAILAAPSDIKDLIYDGPSSSAASPAVKSSRNSYGSQPSAAIQPVIKPTAAAIVAPSESRTELARISDAPLPPVESEVVPAPTKPTDTTEAKSAFFDGLMDQGTPAGQPVKEKKIVTADAANPAPAEAKPMDILDPTPLLAPTTAKPSSQNPPPVGTAAIAPLPPIMGNAPTDIAKQIDNSPVASNDLAAPGMMSSELPNIQADMTTSREWSALKNQTLRQTLTAWAEQAGTSLVWSSEYDYPLQTDVRIQAGYADAVRTLLDGFSKAQPRPIGRLFKNDKVGAQPVLIIETQRLTD